MISSLFSIKLVASSSAREQQKYAVAGGIAEEVLSSIKTVTAFNGQEREIKRYVLSVCIMLKKKKTLASHFIF